MNYILNGQSHGDVATRLMQHNWDAGALRPFIDDNGQTCLIVNDRGTYKKIVTNAPTSLRKDAWIEMDSAVITSARQRLRLVADLRGANLVYNLPNGMAKTMLETETMGDIEDATISMEPAVEDRADEFQFGLTTIPLPIIHKGFHYTSRQVANHQLNGTALDTSHASQAAVRVAEKVEKFALGVHPEYRYGGGYVYGLINFPGRITTTITLPTHASWSPKLFVDEVIGLKELARAALQYGPYKLYLGDAWESHLDRDYSETDKAFGTLRSRLAQISNISSIETLDFLPGYQVVLVQQSTATVRMIIGMDIVTVMWETMGGLKVNFKVLALMVPQVRQDFYGRCGVVHATAVNPS